MTGGTLNNAGQGFDGSISSSGYAELVATDTSTTANVTFTASIPNVTKVEVFVHSASSSGDTRGTCLDTDGVTHTSATLTSASQSFHTIYEGPPITLANVGWGINQNGQTGTGSDGFRAFRVNGYILKDSTSSGEGLVLALPLVGDTNDVSNQINSGSTTKTVTTSGAVASSVQSNLYSGSFFFDGSDDFLNVPDGTDFTVGSAPFTFEFWAYKTASGEDFFWGSSNSSGSNSSMSYSVQTGGGSPSNSLRAHVGDGSSLYTVNSGIDFILNKWVHIAFVRDGNTLRLFQDGVQVGTTSFSGTVKDSADPLMIGRGFGANSHKNFPGYIQDFRFYKGVAKYTNNFIPASTNPDILPETPSGVSGGSKLTKITDGAVTGFESSSDYLSLAASSDFEFTGDHTIEMFIYHNTLSGDSVPYATGGSGSADQIYISSSGQIYYSYGQTGSITSAAGAIVTGKWQHLAISRQGTNLRAFVDGKLVVSSSNSSVTIGRSDATAYIGIRGASDHPVEGFVSNLRIIKGQAVYTSNFIPPTEPLTTTSQGATASNVKLLCCQSPTSATEGAVKPGNITANGGATATNFNPFNTDINTVRGQETGYCTLNPLDTIVSLINGNLETSNSSGWQSTRATIGMTSGKFYWETQNNQDAAAILGISDDRARW